MIARNDTAYRSSVWQSLRHALACGSARTARLAGTPAARLARTFVATAIAWAPIGVVALGGLASTTATQGSPDAQGSSSGNADGQSPGGQGSGGQGSGGQGSGAGGQGGPQDPQGLISYEPGSDEILLKSAEVDGISLKDFIKTAQIVTGKTFVFSENDLQSAADPKITWVGVKRIKRSNFFPFFQTMLYIKGFATLLRGRRRHRADRDRLHGRHQAHRAVGQRPLRASPTTIKDYANQTGVTILTSVPLKYIDANGGAEQPAAVLHVGRIRRSAAGVVRCNVGTSAGVDHAGLRSAGLRGLPTAAPGRQEARGRSRSTPASSNSCTRRPKRPSSTSTRSSTSGSRTSQAGRGQRCQRRGDGHASAPR